MDDRRKLFASKLSDAQKVIHPSSIPQTPCHTLLLDQVPGRERWQICNSENFVELERSLPQRCASIFRNPMSRYHLLKLSPYTCVLLVALGAWTAGAFDA